VADLDTDGPVTDTDGTVTVAGERCVVRFERALAHPIEVVWGAITEPDHLRAWWGDAEIDPALGGRFVLAWRNTDAEGHRAVLHATITALEPPRLLELAGDLHGTLRFELAPAGAGTRLTFTSTVALPDDVRAKVLAGWHFHLDALARALDGGTTDLEHVEGWDALHDRYRARR
jgi:uncharacterized protein YndB with AHSA1/START domain